VKVRKLEEGKDLR